MTSHRKASIPVIIAQLFLPVTLLFIAVFGYWFLKNHFDEENRLSRRNDVNLPVPSLLLSTTSATDDAVDTPLYQPALFMLDSLRRPDCPLLTDTPMLISRIELFTDGLLNTVHITGRELRNAAELLNFTGQLAPGKVELQRKISGLRQAIDAGAVQETVSENADQSQLLREIEFRRRVVFPFYSTLLDDLSADIATLQRVIRDGIVAIDHFMDVSTLIPGWEERIRTAQEKLSDANRQFSEAWTLLEVRHGRKVDSVGTPATLEVIQNTIEQAVAQLNASELEYQNLCLIMQEVLPDPAACAIQIELARQAAVLTPDALHLSRTLAVSVADLSTVYQVCLAKLLPKLSSSAPEVTDGEKLFRKNKVMVSECRILCNVLSVKQIRSITTLPPRLTYLLESMTAYRREKALTLERKNFFDQQILPALHRDSPVLPDLPDSLCLITAAPRIAVLAVTVFDSVNASPMSDAVIRLAGYPDQIPAHNHSGRYTFRVSEPDTYRILISRAGYTPIERTLRIDPAKRKTYAFSFTLSRAVDTEYSDYAFLKPGTDLEGRIIQEKQLIRQTIQRHINQPDVVRELRRMLELRIQLLHSGLEPGPLKYTIDN